MQCAFGLMLGTELVWKKIKRYGKALIVTTLMQSLGTFVLVSFMFGIVFSCTGIPIYLAFVFGGIALATAPAPALSIVSEFHTKGPVTDTLLPMAVLDDIVGIAVFFTVNAFVTKNVSGGDVSFLLIPVIICLPILIGVVTGILAGMVLKKTNGKAARLVALIGGITITVAIGYLLNTKVFVNIALNYTLLGVAFSAAFSNMLPEEKLDEVTKDFHPILAVCLLGAIVDLGAPLPHSGVSLVFTGIICATLEGGGESELAVIVKGTIAAAAVINEIIAVIMAKKGFELAGELNGGAS